MYQVLYRKWRPQVFSDVVGQPQVTVTLQNELKAGRIAHAYLFTGSRGTGKTTCAKILAKAVNCLSLKEGDPCGECESCVGIDNGSVMDVVEIDAASNNGVENIRNLREEASFTPAAAKYRVYIIDEVHMLSIGAFNALLKTLEEPPAHVVFILATTEVHKLPATILSRCQRFDFHRIDPEVIADRLQFVAGEENAHLEREAALLIARIADGGMRDALSLLDQCMGRSSEITLEVVSETAGLAGRDHLFSLADTVLRQNGGQALEQIDELHKASKDMVRLCEELAGHFRNLMLLKTMKNPQNLIVVSQDEYQKLQVQAEAFTLAGTIHAIDVLQAAKERMFRGFDRRVELEMALLKLCSPELDESVDAILRRLARLEKQPRAVIPEQAGAAAPSIKPPAAPMESQRPQTKPQGTNAEPEGCGEEPAAEAADMPQEQEPPEDKKGPVDMEALQQGAKRMTDWPEVLEYLKDYSHVIASAFHGSVAYVNGDFVLIDAPNSMAFELLRKSAQRDKMRVAIKEITGRTYKLGPYRREYQEKKQEKDPLEQLAAAAESAGVSVTKKD